MGFSGLPAKYNTGLNEERIFSHTAYNFPRLLDVCEKLARQVLVKYGGRVEKGAAGEDVFAIPAGAPRPSALELSWAPGPIAGSLFTQEEMARITVKGAGNMARQVEKFAPGWKIGDCGTDMDPGLREEWAGRKNVLATHPLDRNTGCVLSKAVQVPTGRRTTLNLVVGHDPQGDFELIVRADGKELLRKVVGPKTATAHWLTERIDLSPFAGKTVKVELVNQPNGWFCEAAYWAEIALTSE
jgi:hypothetical protein